VLALIPATTGDGALLKRHPALFRGTIFRNSDRA
jgi:hypothetical protein